MSLLILLKLSPLLRKAFNSKFICIIVFFFLRKTLVQLNYSFAVEFTVRSNTTPDCLQFCRPCVAKAASLLQIPVDIYRVGAAFKITRLHMLYLIFPPKYD